MLQSVLNFLTTPITVGEAVFFSPLQIALRFLLPITALLIVYRLLLFLQRKLILTPLKIKQETKTKIARYTRIVLRIILLLAIIIVVSMFLGSQMGRYIGIIADVLSYPFYTAGSSRISIVTVILAIPIFFAASWLSRISRSFIDAALKKMPINKATGFTIAQLARWGIMTIAILIGLSIIGVDLSSIAVIFGVLGIGIGFGLQNTVANFFAGLIIFFERPIKEGDRIIVDGLEGDIVQIRLRSTIINTLTNETIIVPNSRLVGHSIHNYSYDDNRIIIVNQVQVAYESDLDRAREVLLDVAAASPYALEQPPPEARVVSFQDSGILMELWTWIGNAVDKKAATALMNLEMWRAFKLHGIVIPFHQVDLHVKEPVAISSGRESD